MIVLAFAIGFVGVFLPYLRIYALNAKYFPTVGLPDALIAASLASLAVAAGVWLMIRFCSGRTKKFVTLVVLYFLILAWFFLNFFPGLPGYLDGRSISLGDFKFRFVIELWFIGAFALSIIALRGHLLSRIQALCAVICLWSFVGTTPVMIEYWANREPDEKPAVHTIDNDDRKLVNFSNSQNIVLFVLDTFQTDVALKILRKDQNLRAAFRDFTFYKDTASTAAKTYMSVPAILTGQSYDNTNSVRSYLNSAFFQEGSLPYRMHSEGFDTRAFLYVRPPQVASPQLWDNLRKFNKSTELTTLFRMGALSVSPLAGKLLFAQYLSAGQVDGGDALVSFGHDPKTCVNPADAAAQFEAFAARNNFVVNANRDVSLWNKLLKCANATTEQPVFRFFHLQAAHKPELLVPGTAEGTVLPKYEKYETQVHGVLYLLADALKRLRDISVYDGATIVVTSDHGAQEYLANFDPSVFGSSEAPEDADKRRVMAAAMASLLVKPADQKQEQMEVSPLPVTLLDISPTLLKAAGLATDKPSLKELEDSGSRIRQFYFYVFSGWDFKYVKGLRRFTIDGPVWDANAWDDGREVPPPGGHKFASE